MSAYSPVNRNNLTSVFEYFFMKTIIIGAGLAGLGAGNALREQGIAFNIIESARTPGGLAKTDKIENAFFDYTGHYLHVKTKEGFKDLVENTTEFVKVKKQSAVLLENKIIPYPIQYNLKYLSEKQTNKIIEEISSTTDEKANTLTQFIKNHFGPTLLNLFFKPYNEKLWGRSLEELPKDCLGNYFPKIDIDLLMKSTIANVPYQSYNDFFYYPSSGKISMMIDALAKNIEDYIIYDTQVTGIDIKNKICRTNEGQEYKYDHLISSIPLSELNSLIDNMEPAVEEFKFTSIKNVRIIIKGSLNHNYHWFYIPEQKVPFYRLGFPQNVVETACPAGCVSISVEIEKKHGLNYTDQQIADMVISYLKEYNLINFENYISVSSIDISPAYTYNDEHHKNLLDTFIEKLKNNSITTVGRYGLWKYFSMEEAYLSGKQAARSLYKFEEI